MPRIKRSPASKVLSLLMLAAMAVCTLPALAGETSLPQCRALADGYTALVKRDPDAALRKPGAGTADGGWVYPDSPVQTLDRDPASGLKLARTIITLTDYSDDAFVEQAEKQPEKFTPSAALLQAMSDNENQYVEIQHLAGSPYYLAVTTGGTAHCSTMTWFTVKDGKGQAMAGPKSWEATDGGFCGVDMTFGSLDGNLVAIEDAGGGLMPNMSVSATLSTRTSDGWAPDCATTFDFAPRFDAEHVANPGDVPACTDAACLKLREAVLAALEAFQAGPQSALAKALAGLLGDQRAAFDTMRQLWRPQNGDATDNGSTQTSDSPSDALDNDPFALPLQVDGKLYLAMIGHRTIGWRTFSDYQIDVYTLKDGKLDRVNSFLMGMARGKLLQAKAKEGGE
jgi:hypothetical protein